MLESVRFRWAAVIEDAARKILAAQARGDWLTAERARAYGWIWIGACVTICLGLLATAHHGIDVTGKPIGTDFTSFWSASALALRGSPAGAYNVAVHHGEEVAIFGRDTGYAAFFYPPIYLLFCLPLALLPYLPSLAVWLAITGAAYVRMAAAWLGKKAGWLPIFAFPAVFTNAGHGQNGFLSAALLGAGALWLQRRPVLAGVCFGCLAYKPHLGLAIPFVLVFWGQWRTIAASAITIALLATASLVAFGPDSWHGFLSDSQLARATLEQDLVGNAKMQSVFAAVRLWGGGLGLAYAAQVVSAAFALAGLLWLRIMSPRSGAEGPAMIVATVLMSPFLLDYDLVVLAAPMAWLLRRGLDRGFLAWEKVALGAAFVLPAIARIIASDFEVPLTPFVISALYLVLLRRASYDRAGASDEYPHSVGPRNVFRFSRVHAFGGR